MKVTCPGESWEFTHSGRIHTSPKGSLFLSGVLWTLSALTSHGHEFSLLLFVVCLSCLQRPVFIFLRLQKRCNKGLKRMVSQGGNGLKIR